MRAAAVMALEVVVADTAALAERLVVDFEREAGRGIAERGRFAVAVPGGSVASMCFPALAGARADWRRVHVFWADERAVPPQDPESNYGIARALWLEPAHVPAANVHRMPADSTDLIAAAAMYERELTTVLGTPPRFDFVLLGVGPDGHIASLFPRHPAARVDETRLVAAVSDAPKPPPRRLTLTMPILVNAARVVVAAFGAEKADALHDALEGGAATPVAELLRRTDRALVLADRAAGVRLSTSAHT